MSYFLLETVALSLKAKSTVLWWTSRLKVNGFDSKSRGHGFKYRTVSFFLNLITNGPVAADPPHHPLPINRQKKLRKWVNLAKSAMVRLQKVTSRDEPAVPRWVVLTFSEKVTRSNPGQCIFLASTSDQEVGICTWFLRALFFDLIPLRAPLFLGIFRVSAKNA